MSRVHRTANFLFALLVVAGMLALLLLISLIAMFAQSLVPHVLEFCLQAWEFVSMQLAYRAMFLALLVLIYAALSFAVYLWRNAYETSSTLARLLSRTIGLTPSLTRMATDLHIEAQLDLVQDPRAIALCYGWRHPRILVTTGLLVLLSDDEMCAVLAHEEYHRCHRDPLKILFVRALRVGMFFVPIVRDLVEHYLLAQEVAADEQAVEYVGSRAPLAEAIYKMLRAAPSQSRLGVGAFGRLNERVQQLAAPRPLAVVSVPQGRLILSMIVILLMLLATFHPFAPMALGNVFDAGCQRALLDLGSSFQLVS